MSSSVITRANAGLRGARPPEASSTHRPYCGGEGLAGGKTGQGSGRMLDVLEVRIVDRRDFLLMGTAAVLATAFFAGAAAGDDKSPGFDEALKKITGDAKPFESKIGLEL